MVVVQIPRRRLTRVVGTALALTITLQAGITLGGPRISPLGGPSVIESALALTGPPGCAEPTTRSQKDNFAWAGSNAYRLHGWLFYDQAQRLLVEEGPCLWRQWHYGEDSRNCDGCAFKAVSTQTVHGKYWVCGTLRYDSTITQFNVALTTLTPGAWENYGLLCGVQASLSGHQDKMGVFSYDYFLNY